MALREISTRTRSAICTWTVPSPMTSLTTCHEGAIYQVEGVTWKFERFDYAASLDASYIDARFNKASVLLDAGDYARAKVELAAIVEKRPDDYAAQVSLGVAHRGLKELPEARKVWERVIKEAPKRSTPRADAMWNLAILKIDFMDDAAGGKSELERYMQEAPSNHAKRQDVTNKCMEVKCR